LSGNKHLCTGYLCKVNNKEAMSIVTFECLSTAEKTKTLLESATFITNNKFDDLEISLYKLGEEYIEVWFRPVSDCIIDVKKVSNAQINPFLKFFNISTMN
jgi:hypothetical protein